MTRYLKILKAVVTNSRLYIFIGSLVLIGFLTLFLLDRVFMPSYTNYNHSLTVPDITRVSLEEAQEILENHGLRYEVHGKRSNDAYPPDYVIDQSPAASFQVKPNRKIYLTINATETPSVTVPDVVNLSLRNAQIQLQNYGLTVGQISYESSRYKGSVLRQSVTEGRSVDHSTVVDLVVGDGLGDRLVELPDIAGLRLTEAQLRLGDAGLRMGEIRFQETDEFEPGLVLSFSDSDQTRVYEGTTIDLVVSERADAQEESESAPVIEE